MTLESEERQALSDLGVYAKRVLEATPYDVHDQLGRMLDFINETPLLNTTIP